MKVHKVNSLSCVMIQVKMSCLRLKMRFKVLTLMHHIKTSRANKLVRPKSLCVQQRTMRLW